MVDGTAVGGCHLAAPRVGEPRVPATVTAPVVHGDGRVVQTAHQHTLRVGVLEKRLVRVVRCPAAVKALRRCRGRDGDVSEQTGIARTKVREEY